MRKALVPAIALLTLSAVTLSAGGLAFSQPSAAAVQKEKEQAAAELSAEDRTATPFPPGRHAALVKKVCVDCHGAKVITDMRFTREDAERFYKNMVSSDLSTEQAQHIVEYLTVTLAP